MSELKPDSLSAAAFVTKRKVHPRGQDGAEQRFQVVGGPRPHHGPRFERVSEPPDPAAGRRRFVPLTQPPAEGPTVVTTKAAKPTAPVDAERTGGTEAYEVFAPLVETIPADAQDSAPIVAQARNRRVGKRDESGRARHGQAPEGAAAAGSGNGGSGVESTALGGENGPERINISQKIQEILAATPLDRTEEAAPLVDQVTDTLRTIITSASEEAIEGAMIPEPGQLNELFGIQGEENRGVTQQAVENLHEDNLVFTLTIPERGNLGTFVVRNQPAPRIPREQTDEIIHANIDPRSKKPAQTRIIECIEELIAKRKIKAGDIIPNSIRMGELFNTGSHNARAALVAPELEQLLVSPGRGGDRTVAEIDPLTDVATFLKVYVREGGSIPAEPAGTEPQATKDITTFLTQYVQTRDNGQALPSNIELATLLGVNPDIITQTLEQLRDNNLVSQRADPERNETYVVRNEREAPEIAPVAQRTITPGAQAQKAIEVAINARILIPGDRLPPVRQWTSDYDIPSNQVLEMQRNLRDAGEISGRTRRGTIVIGEPLTTEQSRTAKEQIIDHVTRQIATGELKTRDRVNNIEKLAKLFDTSRSNVGVILAGPELSKLVARDGKNLVVADIEPLDLVILFLQEYIREGGRVPTETRPAQGRTATQDITAFLREYIQTRDNGERIPTMDQLEVLFGVTNRPIFESFSRLQEEGLIITSSTGTRIAGEHVTDPMRIATYVSARLDSLPPGEPLPPVQTIAYELATLEGIKPVVIESGEEIAALMREYIKFMNAGDAILSIGQLASILGTSTRQVETGYNILKREQVVETHASGTRVAGEYESEYSRVRAILLKRLQKFQRDERLAPRHEVVRELGITHDVAQKVYEDLAAEGIVYTVPRRGTFATGPYIPPEDQPQEHE